MRVALIAGGVGPIAGVRLHEAIIDSTLAPEGDTSHVAVMHVSHSAVLEPKTEFLLGEHDDNPGEALLRTVADLTMPAVAALGAHAVIGVPCNTFHAGEIWRAFSEGVRERLGGAATLLHIVDETVAHMRERGIRPGARVGVLSTLGSQKLGVHAPALEAAGYTVVGMSEADARALTGAIYALKRSKTDAAAVAEVHRVARAMRCEGADVIILGCSELPAAISNPQFDTMEVVDPTVALARGMLREVDATKLRPL